MHSRIKKLSLLLLFTVIICNNTKDISPDFYLKTLDKEDYFLTEQYEINEYILLSFFATWCAPCRQELPLLDLLSEKYNKIDFVYIGIGDENKPIKSKSIKKFKNDLKLTQTILLDKYGRIFKKFTTSGILPLTLLINNKAEIIYISEGFEPDSSMNNLVDAFQKVENEK